MRTLGLGISDSDLETIPENSKNYDLNALEQNISARINQERLAAGLNPLAYNDDLARVAREHSDNLADENEKFTDMQASCDFPLIHHEGLNFGTYVKDRLNSRGIYYYSQIGENIALITAAKISASYDSLAVGQAAVTACQDERNRLEETFSGRIHAEADNEAKLKIVETEITARQAALSKEKPHTIAAIEWISPDDVASNTVAGWMGSEGHRANILNGDFDETGIGVAEINGYIISTQVFIKRATCGYRGGACCQEAGYYPYCYEPYQCEKGNVCQ